MRDYKKFTLWKEERFLPELEGWELTYNESLKKLSFYAYKEKGSPEDIDSCREEIEWYERELEELRKSWTATSEDFDEVKQKLSKASSNYKWLNKEKVLKGYIIFADDEEFDQRMELAMWAKDITSIWSVVWETWFRSKNTSMEILEATTMPNTKWWWVVVS